MKILPGRSSLRDVHGDLLQSVRQDVSQMRQVILASAKVVLEAVQAVGLVLAAFSLSPRLSLLAFLMSCSAQEAKKYCCSSLNCFPRLMLSFG